MQETFAQLQLMAKLAQGSRTRQVYHISPATARKLTDWVIQTGKMEGFSNSRIGYTYQGVGFVEDDSVPDGEVWLISQGSPE